MRNDRRNLLLRIGFMALLVAGLVLWNQQRKPRELRLEIDLTNVLPGDVTGLDLIVKRNGTLLTRKEVQYGSLGAPGLYATVVHARPGQADVELTLVYAKPPARRITDQVTLDEEKPARLVVRR